VEEEITIVITINRRPGDSLAKMANNMQNENMSFQLGKIKNWLVSLVIVLTFGGLAVMVYMGFYNRYWGDDWCYNADFNDLGIGGTMNTYFLTGEDALRGYSNNRYSLTLVSGLLYLPGISGAKITAALVIGSWLIGLFLLLRNLSKIFGTPACKITLFTIATLLYYNLYLSPQRFQVLYWTAGIHYSFSIITGIFILVLLTSQITRDQRSKTIDVAAALVAFFAGGFSETGCAYLIGLTFLILSAAWWWKRKNAVWAIKAFPTTLIAFIFLLLSLLVLALSPSNSARVDFLGSPPKGLLTALLLSVRFSFGFMLNSIKSQILPNLVYIIAFASLSILYVESAGEHPAPLWKTGILIGVVTIIVWLLISAVFAPSAYFYGTPPDPRGQSLARFTMLAGLAITSWLFGYAIKNRFHGDLLIFVAVLGIAFNMIYVIRSVEVVYSDLPGFVYRAQLWDMRDKDIKAAKEQGATRVEVIVIDMKGVGVKDIMMSKSMSRGWIHNCSSRYYGLEAIKAVGP
jgi:hypothetical protein